MSESPSHITKLLEHIGYESKPCGTNIKWSYEGATSNQTIKANISILQRNQSFHLTSCNIQINMPHFTDGIKAGLKKRALRPTLWETRIDGNGRIRILSQIQWTSDEQTGLTTASQSRFDRHQVVIGFGIQFSISNAELSIQIIDAFTIGPSSPTWWPDVLGSITDALGIIGLKHYKYRSIQEIQIPLVMTGKTWPKKIIGDWSLHTLTDIDTPLPIYLNYHDDQLIIKTSKTTTDLHPGNPLEILESRETARSWSTLDERILLRRSLKDIKKLPSYDADAYVRIAVAPKLPIDAEKFDVLSRINPTTARSLLTLTGMTNLANALDYPDLRLETLSELIRRTSDIYDGALTSGPTGSLIPEFLGDAWAPIKPDMAFTSWMIALPSCDAPQRLYWKIAHLAKTSNHQQHEVDALLSLAKIERRRSEFVTIAHRISVIMQESYASMTARQEEAKDVLLRTLTIHTTNYEAIYSIAHTLQKHDRHREALNTLEELTAQDTPHIDSTMLAKFHVLIAKIWDEREGNTQLARHRYKLALSMGTGLSEEILESAESFFTKIGDAAEVSKVAHLRIEHSDPSTRITAFERSCKHHVSLGDYPKAISDLLCLLQLGHAQIWYMDIIKDAQDAKDVPERQFSNLASQMLDVKTDHFSPQQCQTWRFFAARMINQTHRASKDAMNEFIAPSAIPQLERDESLQLVKYLVSKKDLRTLTTFIGNRITYADNKELSHLLECVIERDLIDQDGILEQALSDYCLKAHDMKLLMTRAEQHINSSRTRDLKSLINSIETNFSGATSLEVFYDHAIKKICATKNQDFSEALEAIALAKLSDPEQDQVSKSTMIQMIIRGEFVRVGTTLLKESINRGELGINNEDLITSIMSEHTDMIAKWHAIGRLKATDPKKRRHHAEQCLSLILTSNDRPSLIIDLLLELNQSKPLSLKDLKLLESICTRDGRIQDWLDIIQMHVVSATDQELQQDYLHWAVRVITSNLGKFDDAADFCIRCWLNHDELSIDQLFLLSQLYNLGNVFDRSATYLKKMLAMPDITKNPSLLITGLDTLNRCKIDKQQFTAIMQTLLSWTDASLDQALYESILEKAISWQTANREQLIMSLRKSIRLGDLDRLALVAPQLLNITERTEGNLSLVMNEWKTLFTNEDRLTMWVELIQLLNTSHYQLLLKRRGRLALLYEYADLLYKAESTRQESRLYFEALFREDPADTRSWIPLFSLYDELGYSQHLVSHLEYIIPRLKRDRHLLEQTPFTLESLKGALRRCREAASDTEREKLQIAGHSNTSRGIVHNLIVMNPTESHSDHPSNTMVVASQQQSNLVSFEKNTSQNASDEPIQHQPSFGASEALALAPLTDALESYDSIHFEIGSRALTAPPANEHKSLDEIQFEETQNVMGNGSGLFEQGSEMNWRQMILEGHTLTGATEKIMKMAFTSDLEKHVAVQSIALLNAELHLLDSWHWQPWRKPQSCDYAMSPRGRVPPLPNLKYYGGPLHRLIHLLAPIIIKSARSRFLIETRLRALGIAPNVKMTIIPFDDPYLARYGLNSYTSQLEYSKIKLVDTQGLGIHVFYDLKTRFIHFDAQWHATLPKTILAHRIIEILVNHQRGQTSLLDLDPHTDIIKTIEKVSDHLLSTGLNRLQIAFGIHQRDLGQDLRGINREQLVSLIAIVGKPSARDVRALQHEMQLKTILTMLASTLDVVGIIESICGRDLTETGALTAGSILKAHPMVKEVLTLTTKLVI